MPVVSALKEAKWMQIELIMVNVLRLSYYGMFYGFCALVFFLLSFRNISEETVFRHSIM